MAKTCNKYGKNGLKSISLNWDHLIDINILMMVVSILVAKVSTTLAKMVITMILYIP